MATATFESHRRPWPRSAWALLPLVLGLSVSAAVSLPPYAIDFQLYYALPLLTGVLATHYGTRAIGPILVLCSVGILRLEFSSLLTDGRLAIGILAGPFLIAVAVFLVLGRDAWSALPLPPARRG